MAASSSSSSSKLSCYNCGSDALDKDPAQGHTVCTECGYILVDNNISSEISFATSSGGRSSKIGTYVPTSGWSGLSRAGGRGFRGGSSTRQITVERGRQKMQGLASLLRLGRNQVDAAVRLLTLAVEHNFTQGRNMDDVCGSCLYIACRRDKSAHMLLDFAECLQRNIYSLGKTYLKLTQLLKLELPLIDPSLYIHRFASQLEYQEKYHMVATTALKLVSCMKRDWMTVGRKPSGICAAALLFASRIHGFKRSVEEVRKVVGVAPSTVNKRCREFIETSKACQLTLDEFQKLDVEALIPADPPAFAEQQKRAEEEQQSLQTGLIEGSGGGLDHDERSAHADAAASSSNNAVPAADSKTLPPAAVPSSSPFVVPVTDTKSSTPSPSGSQPLPASSSSITHSSSQVANESVTETSTTSGARTATGGARIENSESNERPTSSSGQPLLPGNSSESQGEWQEENYDVKLSLEEIEDEEFNNLILNEDEVQAKTQLWHEQNDEYLKEMAELKAHNQRIGKVPRKKRKKRKRVDLTASNAYDTISNVIQDQNIEKKINLKALEELIS